MTIRDKSDMKTEINQSHKLITDLQCDNTTLKMQNKELIDALKALVAHFRANDESYYKSDLCTDAIVALTKAEGKNV